MKQVPLICLLLCLLLLGCDRKELPIAAHDPGQVVTSFVDLGADYRWQFYFDLETHQIVSQNRKTAWDLGFESTAQGYKVVLNTSKAMYAWATGETAFEAVTDTMGLMASRRWDVPSGNPDSTAIGDWRGGPMVYLIDRGYSETGAHQGYRKLMLQSVDAEKYTLRFAQLNGAGDTVFEVAKDSAYNFSFFSFGAGGSIVTIEPPKQAWDLCLTQYLEILPEPYLVTGVLLNRYATEAVMDSSRAFEEIDFDFATNIMKSKALNTIGYAWKYYNFGTATYQVFPEMNYLIEDSKGLVYKLHFVDFYNPQGLKGCPKWEYQQM